jgi:hypothetical protein
MYGLPEIIDEASISTLQQGGSSKYVKLCEPETIMCNSSIERIVDSHFEAATWEIREEGAHT